MDLNEYRESLLEKLNETTLQKEAQGICQQIQIANATEKTGIENDIKSAELAKANAEVVKVNAETEKVRAEITTTKVERVCKIAGTVIAGIGTLGTAAGLVFINGMNIAAHDREEIGFSKECSDREKTVFNKALDLFCKK